jgi:hypothetical protein
MKRITIDLNDDVTPTKLSCYLDLLDRYYREYIKQITIDYFSEMNIKKKSDPIGDL